MRAMLFLILFIPLFSFSQSGKKIKFSGNIDIISYHQGGALMDYDYYQPKPYMTELVVVRYIDSLTIPEVICSIKSDEKGYFEVDLEEGVYGFVLPSEKDNLNPGQFLPTPYYTRTEHTSSSSSWSANVTLPLELKQGNSFGFVLTYANTSSCFTCP